MSSIFDVYDVTPWGDEFARHLYGIPRADALTKKQREIILFFDEFDLGNEICAYARDEGNWFIIGRLGGPNFGNRDEIIVEVNRKVVSDDLDAKGIEWYTRDPGVIGPSTQFIVDLSSKKAQTLMVDYLLALREYASLNEEMLSEKEFEAGVCFYCGDLGRPSGDELNDPELLEKNYSKCSCEEPDYTCQHCHHCPHN